MSQAAQAAPPEDEDEPAPAPEPEAPYIPPAELDAIAARARERRLEKLRQLEEEKEDREDRERKPWDAWKPSDDTVYLAEVKAPRKDLISSLRRDLAAAIPVSNSRLKT